MPDNFSPEPLRIPKSAPEVVDRYALAEKLRTLAAHLAAPPGPADDSHAPHALVDAATLLRQRAAEVNEHWCPPACGSQHTYEWPCTFGPDSPHLLPKRVLMDVIETIPAREFLTDPAKAQEMLDAVRAKGDVEFKARHPGVTDDPRADVHIDVVAVTGVERDGKFTETPGMGSASHVQLQMTWVGRV